MPTIWGLTRVSTVDQSTVVQHEAIEAFIKSSSIPGSPIILDEPPGTSARKIKFRQRPMGNRIWREAEQGDILIVTKMDRLGRSVRDIWNVVEGFRRRGVRVIIIQFGGMPVDTDTPVGRMMITMFAMVAEFEGDMIAERTREAFQSMKARGLAVGKPMPSPGMKFVGKARMHKGEGKRLEWDFAQLAILAEVAERMGRHEPVSSIAVDLWRRGLRDHRGLLWGAVSEDLLQAKTHPYNNFYKWSKWFLRAGILGELPPEYNAIAQRCPKPRGFTTKKRQYNWKYGVDIRNLGKKRSKHGVNRNGMNGMNGTAVLHEPQDSWTAEQWQDWYKRKQEIEEQDTGKDELEYEIDC